MKNNKDLTRLKEGIYKMTILTKQASEEFDLEVSKSEGYLTYAIFNNRYPFTMFQIFKDRIKLKLITQFLEFQVESFIEIPLSRITINKTKT